MVTMTPQRICVWLLGMSLGLLGACGAAPSPPAPRAILHLQVTPPNASVVIDDRRVGSARSVMQGPLRMRPGVHFLEVHASGFFSHYERVRFDAGEHRMEIELVARPR